jgi:hypothetical protein
MNERQFEDIIERYPELLEAGLILKGRQVSIKGKFIDLLFEDRHGQKLIVELKVGPIKRDHIGQVMDYEGHLLFPDDPTVRIMLVGNRVPNNFRQSLDYHGVEWREFAYVQLINFLKEKGDTNFLSYFSDSETKGVQHRRKKEIKSKNVVSAEKWVINGISIENEEKARNLFKKIKGEKVLNFLKTLMGSLNEKMEICRAVKHEFKYWPPDGRRCSIYIRPFSNKIDIYLETFSPSDIHERNKLKKIPLTVTENTHNPADQFKSVIIISEELLSEHKDKKVDLLDFLNNLIDDMIQMH